MKPDRLTPEQIKFREQLKDVILVVADRHPSLRGRLYSDEEEARLQAQAATIRTERSRP